MVNIMSPVEGGGAMTGDSFMQVFVDKSVPERNQKTRPLSIHTTKNRTVML